VTTADVEWDDEQRNWMLALHALDAQSCSGCGGWLPDTTAVERDGGYVADPPYRCHRCEALAIKRKKHLQNTSNPEALTVWPVHERR
jgi:hypothetical protein